MEDLFDHEVMCKNCSKEMVRSRSIKDGFELRVWQCPSCQTAIYHPGDLRDYEDYLQLRKQQFNVKLRMVGNSFCVSIPREIIDFQQMMEHEFHNELNQLVRLHLEGPGKVSLFFFRQKTTPSRYSKNESPQDLNNDEGRDEI